MCIDEEKEELMAAAAVAAMVVMVVEELRVGQFRCQRRVRKCDGTLVR